MGRAITAAAGNPWYMARSRAAETNPRLSTRESAAEALSMSVSALADAELDTAKRMPPEKALLMAETYNAPELLNHFCLHECPIGCRRALSDSAVGIELAAVKITRALRKELVQAIKYRLQDIAADGAVSADEVDMLDETVAELRELSKVISELEIIRDRAKGKMKNEKK